jgi:hypothetical protein
MPNRVLVALSCLLAPRAADACGGCFSPPEEVTQVESHRMVIALSPLETVLWDQITYQGDPADFVWVMPVPSTEVSIEIAEGRFFDELDARTAPIVKPRSPPPRPFCSSNAAACGDDDGAAGGGGDQAVDGVTVHDRQTVGPYDTVTLTGESGGALLEWLAVNGYRVPDETLPAIQHYVDRRSAFVVMRLAPGRGDSAMQPVRIGFPGYLSTFPLKMVTVGASGALDLSLWVMAEQRYQSANYATVAVDPATLAWDWSAGRSNYAQAFAAAIEGAGGRAWVVELAQPLKEVPLGAGPDLAIVRGVVPYAFVTRLRTRMLVDHMNEDLELSPSADPSPIGREIFAELDVNRPPDADCGTAACLLDLGRGASSTLAPLLCGVLAITAASTCSRAWRTRRARRSATSSGPPSAPLARRSG